jgi:hypothetical protein
VFDKPPRFDFRTGIPDATLFPVVSGGLNWVKGNRERALGRPLAMRAATGEEPAAPMGITANNHERFTCSKTQR